MAITGTGSVSSSQGVVGNPTAASPAELKNLATALKFMLADLNNDGRLSRGEWQQAGFGAKVGNFNNANTDAKGGVNMREFLAANKG